MNKQAEAIMRDGIAYHRMGNLAEAAARYQQILNTEPHNAGLLYLLGDIAVRQGNNGVAVCLLEASVKATPSVEALTALGCAYRAENFYQEAEEAWKQGLTIQETTELYNNLASSYSDHGQPDIALRYVNRSLELDPTSPNAKWNRSLALLTIQHWPQAWADHDTRFEPSVQTVSTRRNHNCPEWDGTPGVRLAIHGEQGVGDEVMFMSILPDVLKLCPDSVIEVEPRLMDLTERSFGIPTYGNEKAMRAHEKPFDAVIALGSLGRFFRLDDEQFPGTPYLVPDPERVEYWRRQYAMQGPRPFIGVAWQGGTKQTRIAQRSISASDLKFCKRGTVVSLQYGPFAEDTAKENGFLFYPESIGQDLDELAAMAAACDAVVTVAQTLVHIAGGLGVPTHVLTPLHSSWRYGMKSTMPWYSCVKLHRQTKADQWGYPLAECKKAIDQLCRSFEK